MRLTMAVANVQGAKPIKGSKFVILMFLFFFVFAAVFGFGTYFMGKAMAPGLRKSSEAAIQKKLAEEANR